MIVVFGATGSIGGALAELLADAGVPFRAAVRRPDVVIRGAEVVTADLDDPTSLPAALAGAEQLFLNARGAGPVHEGPQPMIAQQEAAIAAAVDAGVGHVVRISAQGAKEGRPLAVGAHARLDAVLAASGIPSTVLAPNAFLQNLLTAGSTFTDEGDLLDPYDGGAMPYLDAADIAACAFAVLTGTAPRGTHVLTGPRLITHADVADALAPVLGRPVRTVRLTSAEVRADALARGLPAPFADDIAELARDVAAGEFAEVTATVHELTGRPPRDVVDFVAAHAEELRAVAASRRIAGAARS